MSTIHQLFSGTPLKSVHVYGGFGKCTFLNFSRSCFWSLNHFDSFCTFLRVHVSWPFRFVARLRQTTPTEANGWRRHSSHFPGQGAVGGNETQVLPQVLCCHAVNRDGIFDVTLPEAGNKNDVTVTLEELGIGCVVSVGWAVKAICWGSRDPHSYFHHSHISPGSQDPLGEDCVQWKFKTTSWRCSSLTMKNV